MSKLMWDAARALDPTGKGRLSLIAEKANVSEGTIRLGMREGRFTRGTALILENAIGAKFLPKEKLCPDLA